MTDENTIAIHSQRIAQAIIDAGQPLVKIVPNRNQRGKLVFLFETTDLVSTILTASKRPQTYTCAFRK